MTDFSSRPHTPRVRLGWIMAGLLFVIGLVTALWWPTVSNAAPWSSDPVTAAWQKAKASGSYDFDADMTQVTIPNATVTNVGRSSRTEQIHLEGQNNLTAKSMMMRIYSEGGSLLDQSGALQVKVENGKTLVRKGEGNWQEEPVFSADSLAPAGDFMSFLAATHDTKANAPETKGDVHFTRYSFTIDGPAFAFYVRDRMEEALRARGELPAGMHLDVPSHYRKMKGTGELWVGSNGLPLRQILNLQMPDQKEQQVHAQITINFSNFGEDAGTLVEFSSPFNQWLYATLGWQLPSVNLLAQWLLPWVLVASAVGMLALLLIYQRRRAVYTSITISIVASILVGPLLTTLGNIQAMDRFNARAQAQSAEQQEADAMQALAPSGAETFNPHIDPLAAAEQAAMDGARMRGTSGSVAGITGADVVLGVTAGPNAAALPVGAINWWQGENSTNDQIGEVPATLQGSATYTNGLVGKAFLFNGTNGYVALQDNSFIFPNRYQGNSKKPFSFELWFKTSSGGVILGQQTTTPYTNPGSYVNAIYVGTDGKLRANMFSAGMTSAGTVNNNQYHHVAVTYDGTAQKLYLDGTQIGTVNTTQQSYANRYRYQLGTGYTRLWTAGNDTWYNFNGILDEPTLYDRALTATEISRIVTARESGKTPYPLTDNGSDVDGDGLTDFQENRLGSEPNNPDTDGDGVSDNDEVRGLSYGGKTWYSDPLDADLDSNNDGIGDGLERDKDKNGTIDDSDSDGTPDLFDADNDNDGVPDHKDLSPFSKATAASNVNFSDTSPLKLTLNSLTAKKPIFVDFQLRPKDAKHLTYAFHVLDWPTDSGGQMQDVDNKTYADLAAAAGRVADVNEALGDVKMVPMLEIRTDGANNNLPSQDDLVPFGITVRDLDASGTKKSLLVPINVVQDEKSGMRVAFSARMRYQSIGGWGAPHEVRLAWVVQALTDIPCDVTDADAAALECAADGYIHNVANPIHVYYDEFALTGLTVREDLGASMAVIYEDPEVDSDKKDDYAVLALATGLDSTFLNGRDADNNSVRDIDINEIVRRFDRTQNSGVPANQRWSVPNTLRVEKKDYAFYDQALMTTAMSETVRILNEKFASSWQADNGIMPYLLFASEQRSRTVTLDGGFTQSSSEVKIDFLSGGRQIEELVYTHVKGQPYCAASGSTPSWETCGTDVFWDELERRYDNLGVLADDINSDDASARTHSTQIYFLSLNQGSGSIVQSGTHVVSGSYSQPTDTELESFIRNVANLGRAAAGVLANQVLLKSFARNSTFIQSVLSSNRNQLKNLRIGGVVSLKTSAGGSQSRARYLSNSRPGEMKAFGAKVIMLGVSVALVALNWEKILPAISHEFATNTELKVMLNTVIVSASVIFPLYELVTVLRSTLFATLPNSQISNLRGDMAGSSFRSNAVGSLFSAAITWGFFLYNFLSSKVTPFSPEFNQALTEAIAATIYLIIITVLSSTAIGAILVAIVNVIDAILTAICELGTGNLRDRPGLGGACFTLGTAFIQFIANLHRSELMVDTSYNDLVVMEALDVKLAKPELGYVAGNDLTFSTPVTTTIRHKDPDPDNKNLMLGYLYLFSIDNIRSNTFTYSLTSDTKEDLSVARNQMNDQWTVSEDHEYVLKSMYRSQASAIASVGPISYTAGLNRSLQAHFNLGYAIPTYECWILIFIPVCYTSEVTGNDSTELQMVQYDILPTTLDGFMALSAKSDGAGLAWDAAFPTLADADNDGLLSMARNGLDPDDTKWDTDGDGLSDANELLRRQNGIAFSPTQCDADNDGLMDAQEEFFGSDPTSRDTDNDGLTDGDEVWHQVYNASCQPTTTWSGGWEISINGASTFTLRISSDPTQADVDGDGISDLAEKQLAQHSNSAFRVDKYNRPYNPNVYNINPLNVIVTINDADGVLRPNQQIIYTTTVVADVPLLPSIVDITAPYITPVYGPQALQFDPNTFATSQSASNAVNMTVGQQTGSYRLTSSVRARLGFTATVAPWIGNPLPVQSIAISFGKLFGTGVAASRTGSTNPFLLSLTHDNMTANVLGEVRSYALPNSAPVSTLKSITTTANERFADNQPPNMACNNAGVCLVVWTETVASTIPGVSRESRVNGALVDASGQLKQRLSYGFFGYGDGRPIAGGAPVVASDGTDFVVAYFAAVPSGSNVQYYAGSMRLKSDGTIGRASSTLGSYSLLLPQTSSSYLFSPFTHQIAWIGDRYRVTRRQLNDSKIFGFDLRSTGAGLSVSDFTLVSDAETEGLPNSNPRWRHTYAYDPVSERSVLVYRHSTRVLRGVVYQGTSTTALTSRDLSTDENPQISYDPNSHTFLFTTMRGGSTTTAYSLLDNNLNPIGNSSTVAWGSSVNEAQNRSQVCPLVPDAPILNLRFEDLPGATTYLDSSGNNNNALCAENQCPTPGILGAVDKNNVAATDDLFGTASDYAMSFNSTGATTYSRMVTSKPITLTQFTLAFWFKMPPPAGNPSLFGATLLTTAGNTLNGGIDELKVQNSNGALRIQVGDNLFNFIQTPGRIDDNQWHQAVITRIPTANTQATHMWLYLDGNPTPVSTKLAFAGADVTIANKILRIGGVGGQGFTGGLDGVQIYPVALDANRVKALYDRTALPSCVMATLSNNSVKWTQLQLLPQDTRGGKISASGGVSITIDTAPPTSAISSLSNNQYIQGSSTGKIIQVAGATSDRDSYVTKVQVSVNGGAAQPATGTSTWVYPLQVTEGRYDITAFATDAATLVQPTSTRPKVTIYADATAPNINFTLQPNPNVLQRNPAGRWVVLLGGGVGDPAIGSVAGSGVVTNSVEATLKGQNGLVLGNDWQEAIVGPGTWSLNYLLPEGVEDPTGTYTVTLRASDKVGNLRQSSTVLMVDNTGPDAKLTTTDINTGVFTNTISTTVTIGGVISETGSAGLRQVDIAMTPITQVLVMSGTVLRLDFPNSYGVYNDSSTQGNRVYCPAGSTCPVFEPSAVRRSGDTAVRFNGSTQVLVAETAIQGDFTAGYWIKAANGVNNSTIIIDQGANVANGWTLSLDAGRPAFLVNTGEYLVSPNRIDDDQWHFVVGTRARNNGVMKLYVDGGLAGTRSAGTNLLTAFKDLRFGSDRSNSRRLNGALDSIRLLSRALNEAEVRALQAETLNTWSTIGYFLPGITTETWQYQLPNTLEGIYQIDLEAWDGKSNVRPSSYAWRGVIDMLAPRLTFTATATGESRLDNGTQLYEIRYVCRAEDWTLIEESFDCPGNASQPPSRSFNSDPLLQAQFPELTLLTTMVNTYTIWAESPTPSGTLTACDSVGHCATLNVQATAASAAASQMIAAASVNTISELPKAVVVSPLDSSTVDGSNGNVEVTIAAEAAKTLKDVTLLVDGEIVATFPYARIDKLQTALSTVNLNLSDGGHTLSAYASDWTGAVQSAMSNVTVFVNSKTTQLSIDGGLGVSRTWQLGSGVLVLEGNVSNVENLAAVQVKVGDQGYIDAQFGDGRWGVAYPVTDPEGKTLAISVRAIDKAGQVTQIGDGLATDFSTANPPETTINNAPAANSNSTNATFSFSGDKGDAAFKCQLDEEAYSPCASPVTYNDLSNGSHSFRVKAINGQGFEDLSPASYSWNVEGSGALVAIGSGPAATTASRSAKFEFKGSGTIECSLDGAAFTACSSPATYTGLGDGTHAFLVRVKGNPASKFVWKVSNSAPVAVSQVVTTAQNSKLPVTLVASDESALKYIIVNKPTNGTLSGVGANVVYQPATDFFGTDSFSFKADDGDATSNLATVTINIAPTPGQDGVERGNFVVFGTEGVILREAVKVMSGDIAASMASQGPWLGDGAEVSIGEKVTFADATSKVMGDTLFLGEKAVVGNVNFNELRGPGKVSGTKVTPQALPLLNRFVSLPAIGVGKQDVIVASAGSATVAPGNYQSLKVGERGEVTFTGGVYSFKEWNVGEKTKLYFAGATEIRISGQALVGEYGYVGPAPSSAVTAKQIVIYVAGVNASIGNLGGLGAKAATFGPYATLAANVVVPNGTLLIRERSKAVGSFVGRWVSVGKFSELTLANRFSNSQIDGRVDSFFNLTLDDATGLNSTAPLSADVDAELLSEEGSNEEVPTSSQPSKIYLPVISSGSVGQSNSQAVESAPFAVAPEDEDARNMIYLPNISR